MNSSSHFSHSATPSELSAQQAARHALRHRQRLETLWGTPAVKREQSTAQSWLRRLGQWLLQSMTDSDQVRIWTKITPNGLQWCAYDPQHQRSFATLSEADLRTWLDQRHRL